MVDTVDFEDLGLAALVDKLLEDATLATDLFCRSHCYACDFATLSTENLQRTSFEFSVVSATWESVVSFYWGHTIATEPR